MAIFKKNVESLVSELEEHKENFLHAQDECEKLTSEIESLKESLKGAQEDLATKNAEIEELAKSNSELTTKIETLESESVEVESEVERKLTEKLSEAGVTDPVEEIADEDMQEPTVLERFIELSGQEKTDFYNKHEQELKKLIL